MQNWKIKEIFLIVGCSSMGKSTIAKEIVSFYKKINLKSKIIAFDDIINENLVNKAKSDLDEDVKESNNFFTYNNLDYKIFELFADKLLEILINIKNDFEIIVIDTIEFSYSLKILVEKTPKEISKYIVQLSSNLKEYINRVRIRNLTATNLINQNDSSILYSCRLTLTSIKQFMMFYTPISIHSHYISQKIDYNYIVELLKISKESDQLVINKSQKMKYLSTNENDFLKNYSSAIVSKHQDILSFFTKKFKKRYISIKPLLHDNCYDTTINTAKLLTYNIIQDKNKLGNIMCLYMNFHYMPKSLNREKTFKRIII